MKREQRTTLKKRNFNYTTICQIQMIYKFTLANLIEINCLMIRSNSHRAKYEFWGFEIGQKQFLFRYDRWIQEVKTHL